MDEEKEVRSRGKIQREREWSKILLLFQKILHFILLYYFFGRIPTGLSHIHVSTFAKWLSKKYMFAIWAFMILFNIYHLLTKKNIYRLNICQFWTKKTYICQLSTMYTHLTKKKVQCTLDQKKKVQCIALIMMTILQMRLWSSMYNISIENSIFDQINK